MASLDTLPPDQRAVLQLVLQRGRSYDEIARMLSIDRAAVRERALAASDALGPGTRVAPERRALITDHLLGQLPEPVAEDTRRHLAESPAERAWARVVASELGTLSSGPLPEIPVEVAEPAQPPAAAVAATPEREEQPVAAGAAREEPAPAAASQQQPEARRSSRRGGALLLAFGAVAAVVVVAVILIADSGGSSKHDSATASASAPPTSTAPSTAPSTTATATSTTATASATPVARVILTSPTGDKKLAGAAVVVTEGSKTGIVIRATGLTANTSHDAYAVWLFNSPTDSHLLGFVNPGVKSDGVLQAGSLLPASVSHFKQLLITLETQAKPQAPGQTVLKGPLNVP